MFNNCSFGSTIFVNTTGGPFNVVGPGSYLRFFQKNTAASGNVIGVITPGAKAVQPFTMEYGVPFSNGLTIVMTGTWDVSIVYE